MKQFKTIFKFELKNYFKNKAFVGITLFLVLAITVVMFLPRITSLFGSDGDENVDGSEKEIMLVKASSEDIEEIVSSTFSVSFPEYDIKMTTQSDEQIKQLITDGEAECAFVMTGMESYVYYVENMSLYDTNPDVAREALTQVYRTGAMMAGGLSAEDATAIMSFTVTGESVSLGKNQMDNFFYTYIMIFALYMVVLLYGQMVSMGVATEKSSRAMEVLITSAKPTAMMFAKVFAACLAGLVQLVAVFGSAMVFYKVNEDYWGDNPIITSIFNIPADLLAYMLIFFVLGFLIYAFLYGAIGSTVSKLEDINTAVTPLTYVFIIAFIVVITSMGSGEVDNLAMRVCSYIPFTSPMAMFTRIAMSTVPLYEIILSIAVLVVSVFGVGVVSARIYRMGVVLYGNRMKLTAILKAIRK